MRVLATDLTESLALDLALAYTGATQAVVVVPLSAAANTLTDSLRAGQAELALTVTPDPALFGTPVGYVPLVLVVNPDNPLDSLPLATAQAMFAGQVTDWAAAGGESGPVAVMARAPDSDAGRAFADQFWGGAEGTITTNARLALTWDAMRAQVAADPQALGYTLGSRLDETLKPLALTDADGAEVTLQLLAVAQVSGDPRGPARDWLAWAQSWQGQNVVARRHTALP